jgi:iron transport multicopper oxidase
MELAEHRGFNAPNASFGNTTPGVKSTALTLLTTNAVTGYSTQFPISLTGTEVSSKAYLSLTPITVDYGGVVILQTRRHPQSVYHS